MAMIVGVAVVHHFRQGAPTDRPEDGRVAPAEMSSFAREARDGLEAMIAVTAAVFWSFFFLTGLALFILRTKDADVPRPFRVPLYPILPIVFCGWCGYMVFAAIEYKRLESLIGLGLLVAGLPFYFMPETRRPASIPKEPEPAPVGSGFEHHV